MIAFGNKGGGEWGKEGKVGFMVLEREKKREKKEKKKSRKPTLFSLIYATT